MASVVTQRSARNHQVQTDSNGHRQPPLRVVPGLDLSTKQSKLPPLPELNTKQQQEVYTMYNLLSKQLKRPPSVQELKKEFDNVLSVDRYRAIIKDINQQLPTEMQISCTTHKPYFLYYKQVKKAFLDHYKSNHEPPEFRRFLKDLRAQGIKVTPTPLQSIISSIREEAPKKQKNIWHFSKKRRDDVTWPQIITAHGEAVELLKRQGTTRNPCAEEVSYFLKKAKINFSPRALEFRYNSRPSSVAIIIDPYQDTTLQTIKTCHAELYKSLRRNPAIAEITKAVNAISIKSYSPEAIWTRITHHNYNNPKQKIDLTPTLRSGIYDSDITHYYLKLKISLQRPPTFQELRKSIQQEMPHTSIREDTFQRRTSALKLELTSENTLKASEQHELAQTIYRLRADLKRPPLRSEVLESLKEQESSINEQEITRILGTMKKRLSPELRRGYHLAFPHHICGQLSLAYQKLLAQKQQPPSISELAQKTRWSEKGVAQLLSIAQVHEARHNRPPLMVEGSSLYNDLSLLKGFMQQVRGSVRDHSALFRSDLGQISPELKKTFHNLLGSEFARARFYIQFPEITDLRLQALWTVALYHHTAQAQIAASTIEKATLRSFNWARRHQFDSIKGNPFTGVPIALIAAVATERLSRSVAKDILEEVDKSYNSEEALRKIKATFSSIAETSGFYRA